MVLCSLHQTLTTLYQRDDDVEVRAFSPAGERSIGRYPRSQQLLEVLEAFDRDPTGYDLYIVLNPILISENLPYRPLCGSSFAARWQQVARRRWFLLDGDPIRDYIREDQRQPILYPVLDADGAPLLEDGQPVLEPHRHKVATEAEWQATYDLMALVRQYLVGLGFEKVVLASSGNGCHVLVYVDLPNTGAARRLIEKVQQRVLEKFSAPGVDIQAFSDANRLVRCYGSLNRKGHEAPNRTYRRSGVIYE